MTIEAEDVGPLLDEVERFARTRLAAAVARPEIPIPEAALAALTAEARDLGLLPGGDGGGFGLWSDVDGAPGMAVSLGVLRAIARVDAATAFAWHRLALAGFVTDRLGLAPAGDPLAATLTVTGHHGLGRDAFAAWLDGRRFGDETRAFLADWLDRDAHAAVVVAPSDWRSLVWPVWSGEAVLWERIGRDDLLVEAQPNQHGFDGLSGFLVRRARQSEAGRGGDVAAARRLAATVLKLDLLGLLAVGAGALDHAASLARDYAHVRRQGGRLIADHAAVRLLLGEIDAARHGADLALAAAIGAVDALDLAAVVRSRIVTQEALCRGANQAVQVFGGIGYMRDTGAEKILRDANMLRLQSGGLLGARLFAAHLGGERA